MSILSAKEIVKRSVSERVRRSTSASEKNKGGVQENEEEHGGARMKEHLRVRAL